MDILPQNNNFLTGHDNAEQMFLRAWQSGAFPHAWIISGPAGIGKATLAYRLAKFLFAADYDYKEKYTNLSIDQNSSIFKQVASGSYPDLKVLERDYIETDRKKIIGAIRKGEALNEDELSSMKKSAYIRVDEVRKVNEFLAKTSFNNGWRAVIVDSADDMNKSSANALLKILEEPPAQTVFLLISHNPGMLLPTIRSRCAKMVLQSLKDSDVASLLRRYRSELNETKISKIVAISSGSIGRALKYADLDALDIYDKLCEILYAHGKFSLDKLWHFCSDISADIDKFDIFQEILEKWIKDNIASSKDVQGMYECWQKMQIMFADCRNINMDKKQTLINLLNDISKVV